MNAKNKKLALRLLKRLFEGSQIEGVLFGTVKQLLIKQGGSYRGQIYLNLASSWMVVDALPDPLPSGEDDFPDLSEEEELSVICSLRHQTISKLELGNNHPHLILTLENGAIFLLNGIHYGYECWQAGVSGNSGENSLVVATPGGDLAVWLPRGFE